MTPLIRRREPRVLALDHNKTSVAFVVADIHELRGSGEEPTTPRTHRLRLRRLILREHPTAVVLKGDASMLPPSIRDRIPVIPVPHRLLPFRAIVAAYPEAAAFAPNARLKRLSRIAITALIRGAIPSRRYEKHPRR